MSDRRKSPAGDGRLALAHTRFGWTALFLFMAFGLTLEGVLGFKAPELLMDTVRREMWRLSHAHGALLAILNLVYIRWADQERLSPASRGWASRALLAGSLLQPLGFFLGGLVHFEGDPGLGILLVPMGALLLLYAIAIQALAAWRRD